MKSSRPTKVITDAPAPEATGWWGVLSRQANNILTVLLLIAAVVMFVRWRTQSAANAKIAIVMELSNAQAEVERLRNVSGGTPADVIKAVNQVQNAANGGISSVLNSSDADARMRAQAFIARGDMYWYLASMPALPGSSSQPNLTLAESSSAYLQKASDAYQEVLKNSTYRDLTESQSIAHMGMGYIAENRRDWDAARKEFETVANDSKALEVLSTAAKIQLGSLDSLKTQYYLVGPEGSPKPVAPVIAPTPMPTLPPLPTTLPSATMPALPTTRVSVPATTLPSVNLPPPAKK